MANGNDSPLKKTWIRLLKNKPAIASLIVICIAIVLAIIGPSIAPDKTPDADDQILEIANVNPGFSIQLLLSHQIGLDIRVGRFHTPKLVGV